MKHIYDNEWEGRLRVETWTGVIFTVICGLLIAWSLAGCVKRQFPPHAHIPECYHNREYKCEFPAKYREMYEDFTATWHCDRLKCSICGKWLKK